MSGGSFDYLCWMSRGEVLDSERLEEMAAELDALGYPARDVATRTRALLLLRDEIDEHIKALAPVWKSVEWWRSCDSARDDVLVAIGEYRERQRSESAS